MKEKDFELIYEKDKKDFKIIKIKDQFRIKLRGERGIGVNIFKKDGELRERIDERLLKKLGKIAEEVIVEKEKVIESSKSKKKVIYDKLKNKDLDDDEIDSLNDESNKLNETITEAEKEIAKIENRMKLGDRIRSIFKKHGLTIITITSAGYIGDCCQSKNRIIKTGKKYWKRFKRYR